MANIQEVVEQVRSQVARQKALLTLCDFLESIGNLEAAFSEAKKKKDNIENELVAVEKELSDKNELIASAQKLLDGVKAEADAIIAGANEKAGGLIDSANEKVAQILGEANTEVSKCNHQLDVIQTEIARADETLQAKNEELKKLNDKIEETKANLLKVING